MNSQINVLLIVEGNKTERKFFEQISKVFGLKFKISCYKTNIYTLYKRMKEYNFDSDIKTILLEQTEDVSEKEILNQKFAYTYLIFDCDLQHSETNENELTIDYLVSKNMSELKEMVQYFDNETDPTIGKLYVNYPMMESYKDCESFFDTNYSTNYINIDHLKKYKSIVGTKKLSNKRIDNYTYEDFKKLSKQNIYKLNKIINNLWNTLNYKNYQSISPIDIINAEETIINQQREIAVLNTSLFLIIDYFGNNNNFYDNFIN